MDVSGDLSDATGRPTQHLPWTGLQQDTGAALRGPSANLRRHRRIRTGQARAPAPQGPLQQCLARLTRLFRSVHGSHGILADGVWLRQGVVGGSWKIGRDRPQMSTERSVNCHINHLMLQFNWSEAGKLVRKAGPESWSRKLVRKAVPESLSGSWSKWSANLVCLRPILQILFHGVNLCNIHAPWTLQQ